MNYTYTDIDEVASISTLSDKHKIDELLRIDCSMYTNLGLDSTKQEVSKVYVTSKKIYKLINKIDNTMGSLFLNALE